VFASAVLCLVPGTSPAQTTSAQSTKEKTVNHASGTFDVKLAPLTDEFSSDTGIGRNSIDKVFHGDLEGTSKGQMLAAMGSIKGSAGYVAMEKVTGTLKGRAGTFVLQHSATMTRGTPELSIKVMPDSGTDQLEGITGTLNIKIEDGNHSYEFDYSLPRRM
jgi:Protein of unknown function (DUF3224)